VAKTYRFHARLDPNLIAQVVPQLKRKETMTSFVEQAMARLAHERKESKTRKRQNA